MPGNVRHEDADPVLIDRNEIVEIARNCCHGTVGGADAKLIHLRDALGKNGHLDLAGRRELVLDRQQPAFVGEHQPQRDVAERG